MRKCSLRRFAIILLLSMLLSISAFASEDWGKAGFSDVTNNNPCYEAITAMANKGVIIGYSDSTFKPDNATTSGEFAVEVCRTFYRNEIKGNFTGTTCIQFLRHVGIVSGNYELNTSDELITRAAAADIIGKIKGYCSSDSWWNFICYTITYSDFDKINFEQRNYVLAAIFAGYLNVENNKVNPDGYVTRAELCDILYKATVTNPNPSFPIPQVLDNMNITFLDNSTAAYCSSTVEQMKYIPPKLITLFVNNNWYLKFTSKYMDGALGYNGSTSNGTAFSRCIGLTMYDSKTILVKFNKDCIIHEFGHFLDYLTGISSNPDMRTCINKEAKYLYKVSNDDYSTIDSTEYFAVAFQKYCYTGSENFGQTMPLTRELIERALASLPE